MRFAPVHPRAQFACVEWLGEIVVGARVEPAHDVFPPVLRREQDQVRGNAALLGADRAAQVDAVQSRHHPIEDGHRQRLDRP